jgi:hypothetical protein
MLICSSQHNPIQSRLRAGRQMRHYQFTVAIMREIKFKAWNRVDRHWVDWDQIFDLKIYIQSEHHELVQFTGLKDENGSEIWEGDIIRDNDGGSIWQVIFEHGEFYGVKSKGGERSLWIHAEDLEVIGNIYENPELVS